MDFPKLVYDDFYKFFMSFGIILLVIGLGLGISIVNNLISNYQWIFIILCISILISSIVIMKRAGQKWYANQRLLDRKLKAETELAEQTTERRIKPEKETTELKKETISDRAEDKANVALVSYKIASVLPNTVSFNFLKDWQVWFTIENHEKKKYKAYIKIKFIMSDGYEGDAGGYYGGDIAWRLNALSGIIAPGLGIPEKIREKVKLGKGIKIRILGEIKDENDNLIERKLPVEYIYDPKNNSWYLEP